MVYRQTAELPAKGSTPVLQPLPQPPLRHSKSLQVAPEAQPAALLLVDVLTATHVAAISAPHDQQQEEGASDVQQTQQIVCGLTFEDTLNNAHTGDKMVLEIAIHVCAHPTITRKCLKHLLSLLAFNHSQAAVVGNGCL